jgi:hypothetical protein
MLFKAGDGVWYRGQYGSDEYEGLVRGISTPKPPAAEPTYILTLLSGPYAGTTSVVYERELRPRGQREYTGRGRGLSVG